MALFSKNKYKTRDGRVIDLPVGMTVEMERRRCSYGIAGERFTFSFGQYPNRDVAVQTALNEFKAMIDAGFLPGSKAVEPKPLPCGNKVRWITYTEQVTPNGSLACRFNATLPDYKLDKMKTYSFHIGINVSPNDIVYHERLAEVIDIVIRRRDEYLAEFVKRFPVILSPEEVNNAGSK